MRIIHLACITLISLVSCETVETESSSVRFVTTPIQTPSLLAKANLKGFPGDQRMELAIEFENLTAEEITIAEIALNNSEGLNSTVESITGKKLILLAGRDTTLQTTIYSHVNDKKLFHTTGLPGLIDSLYTLSILYTISGKDGVRVMNLISRMPSETFLAYRKEYYTPIQAYVVNTASGYDVKQREFLGANNGTKSSPFVHVTEQEVAVSGLNLRIKCFHRRDSLYSEIFAVNHSEMIIEIDTTKIDLIVDGLTNGMGASVMIEKVTGAKDDVHVLAKGDRTIITLRKNLKQPPDKLLLSFADSFFLASGKPLFKEHLPMIKASNAVAPQ